MPANGQALILHSIIIKGVSVKGTLPSKLPTLEELMICAHGCVELTFEDPLATSSRLSMYMFHMGGGALTPHGKELPTVLAAAQRCMTQRGLALRSASAIGQNCARMCLNPVAATELFLLHMPGKEMVGQCRCRACFDCLRRAGYTSGVDESG